MKKRIGSLLILCGMLFALSACGKAFICDFCGQEKTGRSHTMTLFGVESHVCHDCYEDLEEMAKGVSEFLGA